MSIPKILEFGWSIPKLLETVNYILLMLGYGTKTIPKILEILKTIPKILEILETIIFYLYWVMGPRNHSKFSCQLYFTLGYGTNDF